MVADPRCGSSESNKLYETLRLAPEPGAHRCRSRCHPAGWHLAPEHDRLERLRQLEILTLRDLGRPLPESLTKRSFLPDL